MKKAKLLTNSALIATALSALSITAFCSCSQDKEIKVKTITISDGPTKEIIVGTSFTFTAKVLPQNATNKSLTWSSSNKTIVDVDRKGTITAKAVSANPVIITATAKDGSGVKGTCNIIVNPKPLQDITLSTDKIDNLALDSTDPSELSAQISATLNYNVFNADDEISWTVDEAGKDFIQLSKDKSVSTEAITITPLKMGVAILTASCKGKTATCTIDVGYNQDVVVDGDIVYGNLTGIYNESGSRRNITGKAINANVDDLNVSSKTFNKQVVIGKKVNKIDKGFLCVCLAFNQPLAIPDSVTIIGDNFMMACSEFNQELNVPNNVQSIGSCFMAECLAFNNGQSAGTSTKPFAIPKITEIKDDFMICCYAFNQQITVSNSVISIGNRFLCGCIQFNQAITLSDNITSIGIEFLSTCAAFNQEITLTNKLTKIDSNFLSGCTAFNNNGKTFIIPNQIITINKGFLYNCTGFKQTIKFDANSQLKDCPGFYDSSRTYDFAESGIDLLSNGLLYNSTSKSALVATNKFDGNIPDGCTYIGCNFMDNLTIPEQVTQIKIPDSVTAIGDYFMHNCINNCRSLNVIISKNITEIGQEFMGLCYYFDGATIDFSSITNPDNLTIDGTTMFEDISSNILIIKVASGTKTAWQTKILAAAGLSEWPENWSLTDQ